MKLLQQLICVTGLLACITPCGAEEPVIPPATQPQEHWIMTFDNYQAIDGRAVPYIDLTRDVTVVRDGGTLYIQGIFKDYPHFWVMGKIQGNEFVMANRQLLSTDYCDPLYFYFGSALYHESFGHTFAYYLVSFNTRQDDGYDVFFTVSEDGDTISANRQIDNNACAFWFGDSNDRCPQLCEGWEINYFGEIIKEMHLPQIDYIINIVFQKIDDSGIGNMTNEDADGKSAPMYDLQGRRVNPETAAPGIYIRNHKKILL